jgi:hypothetical protein
VIFLEFDKVGAEWFVVGYLANEPRMIEVHKTHSDPHATTGNLITKAPIPLIKKEASLLGAETDPERIQEVREKKLPELLDLDLPFLPRSQTIRQAGKKCLTEHMAVFTEEGWMPISNLNPTNLIMEDDNAFSHPTQLFQYYHDDFVYHIQHELVDQEITPEHALPVLIQKQKAPTRATIEDILASKNFPSFSLYMPDGQNPIPFSELSISKIPYRGQVYCLSTPTGFFLTRRGTKVSLTGNSNHGLNYGMRYRRFALENEMPEIEAREICTIYREEAYPNVPIWQNATIERVKKQKRHSRYIENCFGRRLSLAFSSLDPSTFNEIVSWVPQSTVADIILQGIASFFTSPEPFHQKAQLASTVHDSLTTQYPLGNLTDMALHIIDMAFNENLLNPILTYSEPFQLGTDLKIGFSMGKADMAEVELSPDPDTMIRNLEAGLAYLTKRKT